MILSYRDARTSRFAAGEREFEPFRRQAEEHLTRLAAAASLGDVVALRSSRLEKLSGDRAGQWSIPINAQRRICFRWHTGAVVPSDVEIVDYH